jgi:uncharacterized membrane protein
MAPQKQPSQLFIMVYPEHATAETVYKRIGEMDRDGRMKVDDRALVTADDQGDLTVVSSNRQAKEGFTKAAAGGLVIGAILSLPVVGYVFAAGPFGVGAHESDRAWEQEFANRVRAILKPNHSAVFVTGDPGTASAEEIVAELAPYGGELAQSSILRATEDMVRKALREANEVMAAEAASAATMAGDDDPAEPVPEA